jgi:hypothetical protein
MIITFNVPAEEDITVEKLAELFEARARANIHLAAAVPDEYSKGLEDWAEIHANMAQDLRNVLADRKAERDDKWSDLRLKLQLRRL